MPPTTTTNTTQSTPDEGGAFKIERTTFLDSWRDHFGQDIQDFLWR
jgi:hypothetical protein